MGFIERHIWQGMQWLLVLMVCQILVQIGIHYAAPPQGDWELGFLLEESNCAEFTRHIETSLDEAIPFTVASFGPAESSAWCVLSLSNELSPDLWHLSPPNHAVLQAARSFEDRQGLFSGPLLVRNEHVLTRALGNWHGHVVFVTALILSLLWLWWWHLKPALNATEPRRAA